MHLPFSLDQSAVNVVLGRSKDPSIIQAPSEQIIRVDCIRDLKHSKSGTLLHLSSSPQFNRYTLPTYLPPR